MQKKQSVLPYKFTLESQSLSLSNSSSVRAFLIGGGPSESGGGGIFSHGAEGTAAGMPLIGGSVAWGIVGIGIIGTAIGG